MNKVKNWERSPDFEWTIDPCFLTSDEFCRNIILLIRNIDSMRIVLDYEGFLWKEYHRIIEESGGSGYAAFIEEWIVILKETGRFEPFSTKKFLSNYDKKIEENCEEMKESLRNCIAASCCSNDKLLLTRKVHTLRTSMVDTELGIKLFDRNKAEEFMPGKGQIKTSVAIQDVLMNRFLRYIEHRIVTKRDADWLYDGTEPKHETSFGKRLFNDLEEYVASCNLACDQQVDVGSGIADAIVSCGNSKVCIELKRAHSSKFKHGLTNQLPNYLHSKRAEYGIYLVMFFGSVDNKTIDERKDQLEKIKKNTPELKKYKIEIFWINCSKRLSASKSVDCHSD